MFTGIVQEVGRVAAVERLDDTHVRLAITCERVVADAAVGDSVAVEGCCLTITSLDDGFTADLMAETLRATSLGGLEIGDPVNLEPALAAGERLGGHLVQGHVDGVGTVTDRVEQPGTVFLRISAPPEVAPYLVAKGSVTVAGTSLTVVDVADDDPSFRVGLIPHTLEVTTLGELAVGDRVNLEADVIAKYVARLLAAGVETPYYTDQEATP